MRINKYLALCGLGSRRGVEKYIEEGRVTINGQKAVSLAADVKDSDNVEFDGSAVAPLKHLYYAVYKPVGYVSTNEDVHAFKKITELSDELVGLSIVGRLDQDSEGLVLMSNDGDFVFRHQHPRNQCEKEYLVDVRIAQAGSSEIISRILRYFVCGARLGAYRTRPASAKIIAKQADIVTFNIVLKEGRKRQIREIFAKERIRVINLKRIRIGQYHLGDMKPGEVKKINA